MTYCHVRLMGITANYFDTHASGCYVQSTCGSLCIDKLVNETFEKIKTKTINFYLI